MLDVAAPARSLFQGLKPQQPDVLLSLIALYRDDPRPQKIDLGVGVYRDAAGATPVFGAVKAAEAVLLETQATKAYLGPEGDLGFLDLIRPMIFAQGAAAADLFGVQTPGGTGALRLAAELANAGTPGARIWLGTPSWPIHAPIFAQAGLTVSTYRYFDSKTQAVCFDEMMTALGGVAPGDVVLLHGCCHNPTGANLSNEQWDQVAASLSRTGALPFIDLAYLGFGDGLAADAYGTLKVVSAVPEALIAFSGSKNFGLYRERIGAAILIARDAAQADITQSQLLNIIRGSYSQPPDHGAEIIRTILEDAELRAEWEAELDLMRNRMIRLREKLSTAIRTRSNAADFDFIAAHRGMFSLLGLENAVVEHLKAANGIYMIGDSRINVAGIPEDRVDDLAEAMLAAIK